MAETATTTVTEVKSEVPVAVAAAPVAEPQQPNPEALMDAPRAQPVEPQFQQVDLEAQAAAPPAASAPAANNPLEHSAITDLATHTDWATLNFLLAFCSFVVMVSASTICGGSVNILGFTVPTGSCGGIPGYQVAAGTISGFFAVVFGLLYQAGKITDVRMLEIVSGFQFLWWVAATIVLTFFGSFQTTLYANGYFGAWGAFIFSSLLLISISPVFQGAVDRAAHSTRSPLLFLTVASAVEMGASIGPCSPSSNCTSYRAFAVALGSISLFISLVLLVIAPSLPKNALKGIAGFLVLWWVIGFGVVTFGGPFLSTGNGYFASAAAVFASVAFLQLVVKMPAK